MVNIIRIVPCLCLFMLVFCVSSFAKDHDIHQFMGPAPGVKYVYISSDGSKVELIGLSKVTQDSLEVEETTYFSEKFLSVGMPKSTSVRYKICIYDEEMIKERGRSKEILLRDPFDGSSNKWKIPGKALTTRSEKRKPSWVTVKSKCKATYTGSRNILGQNRLIITTECVNNELASTFVRIEKYADGIGLVERSLKAISKSGKISEVYKITLKEIINKKKVVLPKNSIRDD